MQKIFAFIYSLLALVTAASAQHGFLIPSEAYSGGTVNDICQDKYGFVWIATDYGLNRYDGYKFTTYTYSYDDTLSIPSNIVTKLLCDRDGNLWVGTRMGLARYDYTDENFVRYQFVPEYPRILSLLQMHNDTLYAGTSGRGLYRLVDDQFKKVPDGMTIPSGNWYFNQMIEDSQHRFWKVGYGKEVTVHDSSGVKVFMADNGVGIKIAEIRGVVYVVSQNGVTSIDSNGVESTTHSTFASYIRCAYCDGSRIYLGTDGDGLCVYDPSTNSYEPVKCSVPNLDMSTAAITAISCDNMGNIWLGCHAKGLVLMPKIQPLFSEWSGRNDYNAIVTSICRGDGDIIWCATGKAGVWGVDGDGHVVARPASPANTRTICRDHQGKYYVAADNILYSYDPLTGKSVKLSSFNSETINAMIDAGDGRLFISTYLYGLTIYDTKTGKTENFRIGQKDTVRGAICSNWLIAILLDRNQRIWFASASGICYYDLRTEKFSKSMLGGVICFSLCQMADGNMLIGSDDGIYVCDGNDTWRFEDGGVLRGKTVNHIATSSDGDIWAATSSGIWQLDADTKSFIAHINGNGLFAKEYFPGGLTTSDGRLCFISAKGLIVFDPIAVSNSKYDIPSVKITGFNIVDKHASNGIPNIENDRFKLSYEDDVFSFEFSLLDFNHPRNIIYEHRIDNGQWIPNTPGDNTLRFSHMPSGKYKLEVRALSFGKYSQTKQIMLEITPPWYNSPIAYVCYVLALVLALIAAAYIWKRGEQRQLDDDKMKFLINATHDIRSPLTIILGALKKIRETYGDAEPVEAAHRNAKRLEQLVTQILDSRKIDKKQMMLHCQETDLNDYIAAICRLYEFNTTERGTSFVRDLGDKPVMAWIDRVNFDKVISNLLSNAFKYTGSNGEVIISLKENAKNILIQVIDSGKGINPVEKNKIFDRFFQSEDAMRGTGIGLNICHDITMLHGGTITASNRTDGVSGAVFTITLPKGNAHLKPEQIATADSIAIVSKSGSNTRYNIIIVDDDKEIIHFVISELSPRYAFDYAYDGKQALKKILANHYDLIISDVVMPEMDGISLLKHIKENPMVSQIPVIMLTSKISIENRLVGLKSGADAYMPKPFEMEELEIQIDNIVNNIRRLKGKFSGAVSQTKRIDNVEVQGNNDALMERVMKVVNANLSDPDFNIDALAQEVGISRANLYRKIKEITGISSGKFLRNIRMEQAARLLKEGQTDVAQISELVGYTDSSHFSTAFKTHFGISPSEYQKANKQQ
ncbi:MAG: response regulator [Bacteroidales bacterium]|nr:response regulator [Bacteroidales bacterium]